MHISILQAVLIGLVYYLGANGTPWLTVNMSWALRRPLISGILVGLILGDSVKGCMVGAAINVTYLAQITQAAPRPWMRAWRELSEQHWRLFQMHPQESQ